MLIGELASLTSLSRDTIRYYEKYGLIKTEQRRDNNYKEYDPDSVTILKAVMRLKQHGYSLREIGEFVDLFTNKTNTCKATKPLLETKLIQLDEKIAELQRIKQNLIAATEKCIEHPRGKACKVLGDLFED